MSHNYAYRDCLLLGESAIKGFTVFSALISAIIRTPDCTVVVLGLFIYIAIIILK